MSAEPAHAPVVDEAKAKRKAEAERKKAEERAKKLEERRAKVQLPLPVIMSTELSWRRHCQTLHPSSVFALTIRSNVSHSHATRHKQKPMQLR